MNEHEEAVRDVENLLSCLNDSPFKFDGAYFNRRHMAEAIVNCVEQVRLTREYAV